MPFASRTQLVLVGRVFGGCRSRDHEWVPLPHCSHGGTKPNVWTQTTHFNMIQYVFQYFHRFFCMFGIIKVCCKVCCDTWAVPRCFVPCTCQAADAADGRDDVPYLSSPIQNGSTEMRLTSPKSPNASQSQMSHREILKFHQWPQDKAVKLGGKV